jgi:hypothetical protein
MWMQNLESVRRCVWCGEPSADQLNVPQTQRWLTRRIKMIDQSKIDLCVEMEN